MTADLSVLDDLDPMKVLEAKAEKIRLAPDIRIPYLDYWNYGPCQHHAEPTPTCEYRLCGGDFWAHQRVGIAWLYTRQRGLLADDTGTGKTNQIYGLLALLKQKGELTGRALIVCKTSAAQQWLMEAHRWVPKMHVVAALSGMSRGARIAKYTQNWDVLIIGSDMMLRDVDMLEQLAPEILVVDDVDPLLNHDTATHKQLNRLARYAPRRIVINATSIQIRLQQLHAALTLTDGHEKFGSIDAFERKHVRTEPITVWNRKTGKKTVKTKTTGYKRMEEFKTKVTPMVLRRKSENLHDVNMPAIMPPNDVWLELYPEQRKRYKELQKGVLKLMAEEGEKVKKVTALSKITYGQQICAGLPALRLYEEQDVPTFEYVDTEPDELGNYATHAKPGKGRKRVPKPYPADHPKAGQQHTHKEQVHVGYEADGKEASVKLDWVMDKTTSEWKGEKIVVFIKNVGLVLSLQKRLAEAGIGSAVIRGGQNASDRQEQVDKFWNDPKCAVMIGTSAIERSLNLQVSQRIVYVDLHLNPARVTQILGRIKRGGSKFKHLYIYNLLCIDTQEEGYKSVLETRQALADYVFDDSSELFEALEPMALLELIGKPKHLVDA